MNTMIKEETRMDAPAKNYLQMYKDHINGYKQYKMEKDSQLAKTVKFPRAEK